MQSVSIIIPVYNSEKTITACLQSIFDSISQNDEVILVNDCSTDSTVSLASGFNTQIISLVKNSGPSTARNAGAEMAANEILVFVDSDMIISKESLERIKNYFHDRKKVQSLTLNFAIDYRSVNYATRYKSHYMSYVTKNNTTKVNYIYGAYCATRKDGFIKWPENIRYTEDSRWGHIQSKMGYEIHCLHEVNAIHLKNYSLKSLIENDLNIAFHFCEKFLDEKRWPTLIGNEEFGHTSKKQMLSVILSVISLFSLGINFNFFLFLVLLWGFVNLNFFTYILKHNSHSFILKTIPWYYIINLTYGIGIISGMSMYVVEKLFPSRVKQVL